MLFVCHPKILHKHCFQFLLGPFQLPRETEDNAYAKFWDDKQRALWFRAERSAESASPREVYNLVTREARVPGVMLATCKVGRPIYTCIYHDGVRPSPSLWRYGAFCVSRQHPRVSCFGNISIGLIFLQPFYESVSAFCSEFRMQKYF